VQENIGAFGRDPGKVTIFGASAGTMSVATSACFRPQAQLRAIFSHVPPRTSGRGGAQLSPAAAHDRRQTIPERPINRIVAGAAVDIDLMVRSNTEETRLFLLSDSSIDRITDEALLAVLAAYGLPAEALSCTVPRIRGPVSGTCSRLFRPWYWRIPAIRLADAHATNAQASHVHVRVRLPLPAVGRSPGGGPRGGDTFRLRYALLWSRFAHIAGRRLKDVVGGLMDAKGRQFWGASAGQ
jgi:carboxylesterase type B